MWKKMTHKESREKMERIVALFIKDFLDDNSALCLDDEEDRKRAAIYLETYLYPFATKLFEASLGLIKQNENLSSDSL